MGRDAPADDLCLGDAGRVLTDRVRTAMAADPADPAAPFQAMGLGCPGSASGQSGPPRGRMQRVIMPAEHAGQSVAPWRW